MRAGPIGPLSMAVRLKRRPTFARWDHYPPRPRPSRAGWPGIAPPREPRDNPEQKTSLALAVAGGAIIAGWAKVQGVPARTAYTWARSKEVRQAIDRFRGRAIDRASSAPARIATAAARSIPPLARRADTEAVQLQDDRAVLADLRTVSDFAELDQRLSEIERSVDEQ